MIATFKDLFELMSPNIEWEPGEVVRVRPCIERERLWSLIACEHCGVETIEVGGMVTSFSGNSAEDWEGCVGCWEDVPENDKR